MEVGLLWLSVLLLILVLGRYSRPLRPCCCCPTWPGSRSPVRSTGAPCNSTGRSEWIPARTLTATTMVDIVIAVTVLEALMALGAYHRRTGRASRAGLSMMLLSGDDC
jgi:hypothetical protein